LMMGQVKSPARACMKGLQQAPREESKSAGDESSSNLSHYF